MPIYEYECNKCGERTEKLIRNGDSGLKECPHCGGDVTKLLSAPMIQFKGTGWYITDYQQKEKKEKEKLTKGSPAGVKGKKATTGGKSNKSSPEKGSEVKTG